MNTNEFLKAVESGEIKSDPAPPQILEIKKDANGEFYASCDAVEITGYSSEEALISFVKKHNAEYKAFPSLTFSHYKNLAGTLIKLSILILIFTTAAAAKNFYLHSSVSNEPSDSAAAALCTGTGEAGVVNPSFALLTNLEAASANAEPLRNYMALLNSNPERFKAQIETVEILKTSQINVYFNFTNEQIKSGAAEGFTEPLFSNNVLITISNNRKSKTDLSPKIAHELEHARQIAKGRLAFGGRCEAQPNGLFKLIWFPSAYDVYDELEAYQAQMKIPNGLKDYSLIAELRAAKTADDKKNILLKFLPHLEKEKQQLDFETMAAGVTMPKFKRLFLGVVTK